MLVERIGDVALSRKLPHLVDVRDLSTDDVRIALELKRDADEKMVMAYLFKHTPLQTNFAVNLTCLVPTENAEAGRPERLDLKQMLWHFLHSRLEVVTNNFNDQPYYFQNRFPKRNFVAFRLRGTKSNRDAIGAVVRIHRDGQVMTRQVSGASGYLSQSSQMVHFGLGESPAMDRIEITWPSGLKQTLDGVAANTLHQVVEPTGGKE